MNILIIVLILMIVLHTLKAFDVISNQQILLYLLSFLAFILLYTLFIRFFPSYIPKNKRFSDLCYIDEKKNKLGPSKCFFSSDCRGKRYCSSEGKCIGESGC